VDSILNRSSTVARGGRTTMGSFRHGRGFERSDGHVRSTMGTRSGDTRGSKPVCMVRDGTIPVMGASNGNANSVDLGARHVFLRLQRWEHDLQIESPSDSVRFTPASTTSIAASRTTTNVSAGLRPSANLVTATAAAESESVPANTDPVVSPTKTSACPPNNLRTIHRRANTCHVSETAKSSAFKCLTFLRVQRSTSVTRPH
jgi:hypothetical protein